MPAFHKSQIHISFTSGTFAAVAKFRSGAWTLEGKDQKSKKESLDYDLQWNGKEIKLEEELSKIPF